MEKLIYLDFGRYVIWTPRVPWKVDPCISCSTVAWSTARDGHGTNPARASTVPSLLRKETQSLKPFE